ncbi:VOC family protein [Vermiculatibacterium agrestimuris]|uniref:VOC family protein n=1 Tax=Vermiculatibacterium agrestimuris TaxID=2941519 RepID=UPI00203D3350|nr:VOC family protein [Vermiculatibacterium agrestimuris]
MDVKELGFELAHIGINQTDTAEGKATAELLCSLFGFACRETEGSYFVGKDEFEVMKSPFLGELGHIAIRTTNTEKAMAYLKEKGIEFDMSTANKGPGGEIRVIYFAKDIAGFRIHLTQKG